MREVHAVPRGRPRLLALIDERHALPETDTVLARGRELANTMQLASLCGLGQAAPLALIRALQDFAREFQAPA